MVAICVGQPGKQNRRAGVLWICAIFGVIAAFCVLSGNSGGLGYLLFMGFPEVLLIWLCGTRPVKS